MPPPPAAAASPQEPPVVPSWLRGLPRAPEYRPTESEFADPIAFLSRVEREAAAFGICKVIPPYQRPSRRYVFAHLNRSLISSNAPPNRTTTSDSSNPTSSPPPPAAVFTTRHQELGTPRRGRPPPQVLKQVWQSGERYTLEQFEAKSRAFSKTHLSGLRDPTPLAVESLFWKASADRPIYIEYANDVPGSGFAASAQSGRQKKRKREGVPMDEMEKASGGKLSSSPWNLQAIARAPGSLTRFMPDDVPGVTSPMMYIGMLFSWFAWHIEDHELHSLNFLHTGAPKTWYAVPGDQAAELEEVIRVHGYGGNPDRLASLAVLGEKTTLMSPEVLVGSGLPCCRLVQYPGEFVVTFPRAYHVGFSHGFNCGEAANFATPQWLKFAKEAAVRRAVMNYLPMLSHQQLLYLLAVSFISRTPRELLYGIRTSRLRDRRKEERELLVKQEFLQDMISENELLCSFLKRKSINNAVLWEPDLLPSSTAPYSCSSGPKALQKTSDDGHDIKSVQCDPKDNGSSDSIACMTGTQPKCMSMDSKSSNAMSASEKEKLDADDEDDLPFDVSIDSGSLTCVACGILGYPFMAILQPSGKALEEMALVDRERFKLNCEEQNHSTVTPCSDDGNSGCPFIASRPPSPVVHANFSHQNVKSHKDGVSLTGKELDGSLLQLTNSSHSCISENTLNPCINTETAEKKISSGCFGTESSEQTRRGDIDAHAVENYAETINWNTSCTFVQPRIFCLQHALELEELLESKGGAHALIICHSDYTKLKALAISIAEELEFQFDCKDVPLANASKSDLHLINISIDDEGHEEVGRDWTSQMGVNMKYFAKLRKETAGSQELPPLSFWKRLNIRDVPSPISVVPNLKWLCRKTRTPYKVVGYVSSPNTTATPEKVDPVVTKTKMCTSGNAYENGKNQRTFQHGGLLQSSRPQEATAVADISMHSEDNDQDRHCLANISIVLAEYPMMHQVCEGLVSVSTCDDSISSVNSQDSPPVAAASDECIIEQQHVQSTELSSSATVSVQQFLVNESITDEGSGKHENSGSCDVTSQCKDKQLQIQGDQENMGLYDSKDRNLAGSCSIEGVAVSEEPHSATVSATLENEGTCAKTYNCSDTVLKTNKSATSHLPESHDPGAVLVTRKSSCDEMISSFDRRGCASTGNSEMPIGSINPVQVGTTAISGENGKSVHTESNSFDILLGVLAEESKLVDAPGKDEVGKASLTLMTLASNEHYADDATQDKVVEISGSSVSASVSYKGQTSANLATDKLLGIQHPENVVSRSIGSSNRRNIICYVRRRHKRKRESQLNTDSSQSCGSFVRSPCESLRPRTKPAVVEEMAKQTKTVEVSAANKGKRTKVVEVFQCDLEFCDMTFETRAELRAHQRNICTDESCGKRFSSHKYLKRHQCVHSDERPFKCPWDGCGMTFKWLWAQTEHVRVHTGERPYKCSVPDCGVTFRYVSDYSRHRKKFNHY